MFMLARLRPDNFTLALIGMIVLALILPVRGEAAVQFGRATDIAIALLFFLHGARLSRQAVFAGLVHWRLHLTVLLFTYALFPILGLGISAVSPWLGMSESLAMGILFLACLPSTVQSSIAFTSIAGGNVPAAVCSASASNLIGVFLTPLLVALLMKTQGGAVSLDSVQAIMVQILLPFLVGQIVRPLILNWISRHGRLVGVVDRGSILMVVYGAFSAAVAHGLLRETPAEGLIGMVVVSTVLLAVVLTATTFVSRWCGFSREDEITIVFCGSKKSLATGVAIANVLFVGPEAGMIVLPVIVFHQIQLVVCSILARRYAEGAGAAGSRL